MKSTTFPKASYYKQMPNKKAAHKFVSRPVHPIKDILLDTKLLADILWNSVLVNNDVHGLVACECL